MPLPVGGYFQVLHFQIDTEMLDINVHPTKMELRFAENEKLYQDVYHTILNTLSHKEMIVQVSVGKEEKEERPLKIKENLPEPFEKSRISTMQQSKEKLNLLAHQTSVPVTRKLSEEDTRGIREVTSSYVVPSWQPPKREQPETVMTEKQVSVTSDADVFTGQATDASKQIKETGSSDGSTDTARSTGKPICAENGRTGRQQCERIRFLFRKASGPE